MPEYGFRNDFAGYGGYIAFAFTVYHNITPLRIPKNPLRSRAAFLYYQLY